MIQAPGAYPGGGCAAYVDSSLKKCRLQHDFISVRLAWKPSRNKRSSLFGLFIIDKEAEEV
jgi:hypothetical protein